jgi:superfamily II DNA or RNA helicase
VEDQFSPQVCVRGQEYFEESRVRLLVSPPDRVVALVSGSRRYSVVLSARGRTLKSSCDCPYFSGEGECKHVWATILAADESGLLQALPRAGPIEVETEEFLDTDAPEEEVGAPEDRGRIAGRSFEVLGGRRRPTSWLQFLNSIRGQDAVPPAAETEILYLVDAQATIEVGALRVEVYQRRRKRDGGYTVPTRRRIRRAELAALPDPTDRRVLALLLGPRQDDSSGWYARFETPDFGFMLECQAADSLLPLLAGTGRLLIRPDLDSPLEPAVWDPGPPWELKLILVSAEGRKGGEEWTLGGSLVRGDEAMDIKEPSLVLAEGFVFARGTLARLDHHRSFEWLAALRLDWSIRVTAGEVDSFLETIWSLAAPPPIEWPEPLRLEQVSLPPRPCLRVLAPRRGAAPSSPLRAEVGFYYDTVLVRGSALRRWALQMEKRRRIARDPEAEARAISFLTELGLRRPSRSRGGREPDHDLEIKPRRLPGVVPRLLAAGWSVEAEGKLYRLAGQFRLEVRSGVDWFDLEAEVEFGDKAAKLPELLAALRRGENSVVLDDGSLGLLPEDWLKKYGLLLGAGATADDRLRFRKSQVGLLDALLRAEPGVTADETFERARAELASFDAIRPAGQPPGFEGRLRPYQEEGLGWLDFLRRFGFGGCLADDMGLGKTVQVLALLESRRELSANDPSSHLPSLIVVPRSLVFNWKSEAARFAPGLRVLDHTGMAREKSIERFRDHHLVLTTYGTLRRDAAFLKDARFEFVILDEAQAIKNADSESARAARLLNGEHRLALSGTPIENHLGELWSLFEFLNPGMLGAAPVFKLLSANGRAIGQEQAALLSRALKPFILRRTKDQVARDLPEKTEQTILCDLDPAERKLYDELREHYRANLLGKIEQRGLGRSKILVLEALLRLRQAACHPGLIDRARRGESSAKLDLLLERVAQVCEEGHKALVFSQFTSFLGIVRQKLDAAGIAYQYLDGRTRDRAEKVERFQNDPGCQLFLISLKAGGLGLNLTAAEYVFLLDPWWNPAVEAQAVDRAHRIGQTRRVFAYRLIARETVEEKVLELQQSKRALADAIINAGNSLIRDLSREDLELLLS